MKNLPAVLLDLEGLWFAFNIDAYQYYERWLAALERLVLETGMVTAEELDSEILRATAADHHDH
jgi:hypothetical protein